jgi:hypothetical protein
MAQNIPKLAISRPSKFTHIEFLFSNDIYHLATLARRPL